MLLEESFVKIVSPSFPFLCVHLFCAFHPDTQVPAYSETFHCFPSCVYYTVIIFLQSMIASQKQLRFWGILYIHFLKMKNSHLLSITKYYH